VPIIDCVDPNRTASLRGIARALNNEGVPTPSGEGEWTAATVSRLRERLDHADVGVLARSLCGQGSFIDRVCGSAGQREGGVTVLSDDHGKFTY
jgi:hypothetical protein